MDTDKNQENTSINSNTDSNKNYLPAIKPRSDVSIAKEFNVNIIKSFSNSEVAKEKTFEENVEKGFS